MKGISMAFDYILDLFGKNRKRRTRFSDVEQKAIELLKSFIDDSICDRDFAMEFDKVRVEFCKLMDDNGQTTIDEDTPLWLNSLLGIHFLDWLKVQRLKWYFEEHPDELVGDTKDRFTNIMEMGHDQRFRRTCKNLLNELSPSKRK